MLKLGQVLTLKNCIEPFSYASTAYVVASALVSVWPICKNLSNLQKKFWANGLPPPLAKNSPYAYDRLFLMALPDKVILSILKLLFAEPVLLRPPILIVLLSCGILFIH